MLITRLLSIAFALVTTSMSPAEGVLWIDLSGQLGRASKPGPPQVQREDITSADDTRPAIFQHAAAPNQPPTQIRFPAYQLPALGQTVTAIRLRSAIGIKDGAAFIDAKSEPIIPKMASEPSTSSRSALAPGTAAS
ncbi:MAG: hypothetical protein ACI9MB_004781 [Verrucomicrobiales bacterium]|jgi:hypothetical protein